jgi:hypothetical protein
LGVQLGEVLGEFVIIVGLVKIRPAGVPGIDPKFSVHGNPSVDGVKFTLQPLH